MHINPRWQKILNDVWGNKQRSLLVILSISIGVGVVGMINNAQYLIQRDLIDAFGDGHPASVQIYTSPAQEDLAHAVADMRQVSDVQIRRVVSAGLILEGGVEDKINLIAVPDYEDIKVSQFTPDRGASVPGLRELVLERNSALKLGLAVGDQIIVKLPDETEYPLTITGIVHDIYEFPYSILGSATGYVSMPTLGWMGVGNYYNRIDLVVEGENSRESALNTAALARDRVIEPAGVVVGSIQIPGINSDPGQHWAQNQIQGFVLILQVMSVMAIFLSGGLVVNTVSAILTQQVRQIGIMRSIGAVRSQITGIYIFNVFVFAFLGWLIAIPLGLAGSWWLANFAANFLNFSLTTLNLAPGLFLLQTVIAFIVPVGVALFPILAGMAISVYDAVYQNGLINEGQKDLVERLLGRINFLSPPMVLSVLNTFRNIPRLAFTLVTLTLAGATFVAAFSTRDSLNAHVADLGRYMWYDAAIKVSGSASRFTAEREALRVPGVVVSEGWAAVSGIEILPDGQEGEAVSIVGLPYDSVMLNPEITSGRWLDQPDSWQVVINEDYLD
ncbi:MAG: ABC transporter permease, partial [Anaerolineae bacterium]|nr:ABC transporter permease [Anaerolineae bacterium]